MVPLRRLSFFSYFRISKPSARTVPEGQVDAEYRRLRSRTFWGVCAAYCLYYVCRMAISVVKQPVVDGGILSPAQIGLVDSALLLVYAVGKFCNGFIADYCNVRRFMAVGLVVSTLANLVMGALGLLHGWLGLSTTLIFLVFALVWGINGWAQSMGAPPAVISLSRWFPLRSRGTFYSILCATPYLGKSLSMILIGHVVLWLGWQYGFLVAALCGFAGSLLILLLVSDTPESKGLPSVQTLSGETPHEADGIPTRQLHLAVLRHPGIWIIALSSAFVYITQYGISSWGIFFLQKAKGYALTDAAYIIAISEGIGVVGTVLAGWLSDRLFRGNRLRPVLLCGVICLLTLSLFLLTRGNYLLNIAFLSLASLTLAALYCIVSGLMALDIVPRKATGAALGVVGISSYVAAALQSTISGVLIESSARGTLPDGVSASYDFTAVAWFWIGACLLSFLLPALFWPLLRRKVA